MAYAPTIVPPSVTPQIQKLCFGISGGTDPYYVDVLPTPDSRKNKCAYNARDEAERKNGKVLFGWSIYSWPGVLVEFIGHAIVETPEQKYCVTPSAYGEKKVLFLPDSSIEFDFTSSDARLPSKSFSVSRHKFVSELIHVQEESKAIRNQYPVTSGQIAVTGENAIKLKRLQEREHMLSQHVIYLHHPPKDKCPCGSGRQFRKCCKPHMQRVFA